MVSASKVRKQVWEAEMVQRGDFIRHEPQKIILLPLQLAPDQSMDVQQQKHYANMGQASASLRPPLGDSAANTDELPAGVHLLQSYVSFLGCCAAAWLFYLLLPRGCRNAYFGRKQKGNKMKSESDAKNNYRNRVPEASAEEDDWFSFAPPAINRLAVQPSTTTTTTTTKNITTLKNLGRDPPPNGASSSLIGTQSNLTQSISLQDSFLAAAEARRRRETKSDQNSSGWEEIPMVDKNDHNVPSVMLPMSMAQDSVDLENHETPAKEGQRYFSHIPSPHHPQINPLPTEAVWRECFRRLQGTGMRLTAHGVQCPSKRIWLQYSGEESTLLWQTEFPRQLPSTASRASTVWVRGAMHRIPAGNVLYIDVGKKTTALLQTPASVAPSTCFSLLTQAGSLDLQANSKLERDSVVSALSYILDIVHQGSDWRQLYDESSTIVSGDREASSLAAPSESNYYNPSAAAISNIPSDLFPPGPNEI